MEPRNWLSLPNTVDLNQPCKNSLTDSSTMLTIRTSEAGWMGRERHEGRSQETSLPKMQRYKTQGLLLKMKILVDRQTNRQTLSSAVLSKVERPFSRKQWLLRQVSTLKLWSKLKRSSHPNQLWVLSLRTLPIISRRVLASMKTSNNTLCSNLSTLRKRTVPRY